MPFSPPYFFLMVALIIGLVLVVQLGVMQIAFDKLGLSPQSASLLLLTSFFGSLINIPLFKIKSEMSEPLPVPRFLRGLLQFRPRQFDGYTEINVNLGGCLLPLTLSVYLIAHGGLMFSEILTGIAIISGVSYLFSRPIHGIGIGMPMFVAPLSAALTGIMVAPTNSAALAYISGTIGVLIGADLFRLKDVKKLGAPTASIGGAGTFDGIFITGLIAVLLT